VSESNTPSSSFATPVTSSGGESLSGDSDSRDSSDCGDADCTTAGWLAREGREEVDSWSGELDEREARREEREEEAVCDEDRLEAGADMLHWTVGERQV